MEILRSVDRIKFVNFTQKDVLRHGLVRKIVGAFEKWEKKPQNRRGTKHGTDTE